MAICRDCQQDMRTADGCIVTELTCKGRRYATFPYGSDPGWKARSGRCGDCGARCGHHHHIGCDIQVCPRCRRQLITCDCRFDELADDYDDDPEDDLDGRDDGDRPDSYASLLAMTLELGEQIRAEEAARVEAARLEANRPGVPVQRRVRLAEAASRSRAHHAALVERIGADADARGRSCDLDVVTACLDAFGPHLGRDGIPLTRPDVNDLLRTRLGGWDVNRDTGLPEGWTAELWTVLTALASGGELAPGSDPVAVLLEPLACSGRIGLDGTPLAQGVDVDFACQCFVPHDPTLPAGFGQVVVGPRGERGEQTLAVARLHPRARPVDPSDWLPWLNLMVRADDQPGTERPDPVFLGVVPGDRRHPDLWLYRPVDGVYVSPLSLDHDGRPYAVHPDRRFRQGYRWDPSWFSRPALAAAGFRATPPPR